MTSGYLLQLIQLASNRLVLRLQLVKSLLELLFLLQHRQPVLRRLDLLMGRLAELPGETLDLHTEPVRPGLGHQYRVREFLRRHLDFTDGQPRRYFCHFRGVSSDSSLHTVLWMWNHDVCSKRSRTEIQPSQEPEKETAPLVVEGVYNRQIYICVKQICKNCILMYMLS
ncbi:hypothetical protein EYF80_004143 [Liparis tanakae]|uniref:Uncharacterized protein n=1 Tax=Liparis tanakae TaxID=230148 RepID=A0A4Z2J5R3_9TELE|nr:hypothetical protein EYF80_004143 [Liparis tanakae]